MIELMLQQLGKGIRRFDSPRLAELVFKHLPFALGIFVSAMILSVAFVYLQPPYYESTARVLVERYKSPTQVSDTVQFPVEIFEAITSSIVMGVWYIA